MATRKRQGEMLRTVFEILLGQSEGLPGREVLSKAEDRLGLTEFEASDYPNRPGSCDGRRPSVSPRSDQ